MSLWQNMRNTLENVVNIAGGTILSGAFIYRTFNPLSILSSKLGIINPIYVGKPTYAAISAGLAIISLSFLGYSIYKAVKNSKIQH